MAHRNLTGLPAKVVARTSPSLAVAVNVIELSGVSVALQDLLTTEPRPRNPVLADAMKRIGIVERSGRGVDKIYRGIFTGIRLPAC